MFKGLMVRKKGEQVHSAVETLRLEDVAAGDVVIKARYSSVNYKDALAVTGKGAILKKFPLVAGIDVVGEVESSLSDSFQEGDEVLVTGCGLGESHDGGLAEKVRVPAEWLVRLPSGLSSLESMVYGTAGFTAALAIHRMELNGLGPEQGPVAVNGASGGVGSIAVCMLASRGYDVLAVSSKSERSSGLVELGANKVVSLDELSLGSRALEKGRFAGVIDNLGGETLPKFIAATKLWGSVASIGLATGHDFSSTVYPHILRGVSLLGISSTNCPMPLRRELWERLAGDLKPKSMELLLTEILPLAGVNELCEKMLSRQTFGRYVIDCRR